MSPFRGALIIMIALSFCIGWAWAHNEVARQCLRLGSFNVNSKTFTCEVKHDHYADGGTEGH